MTILNRLRSAESGSRELDAMIAVSLQIMPSNAFQPCASSDAGTFGTGAHTFWHAPEYTTSIDAALALVERMLPDATIDMYGPENEKPQKENRRWIVNVYKPLAYVGLEYTSEARSPSAPLAILTALFTALAAKDSQT